MNIAAEIIKSNCAVRVRVAGSSMLPFIRTGNYVLIKPAGVDEVVPGDILAYRYNSQEQIICHRLLAKQGGIFILKGDTHIKGPEKIPAKNVLGKVVCIHRGRLTVNLETSFHKFLAPRIAWISNRLPFFLFAVGYTVEAFRDPRRLPAKLTRAIQRYLGCEIIKREDYLYGVSK